MMVSLEENKQDVIVVAPEPEMDVALTTVTSLEDDILLFIFDKIHVRQRIQMEGVSRWWQRLLLKSYSTVRRLDMAEMATKSKTLLIPAADAIWKRCGHGLLDVSFRGLFPFSSSKSGSVIDVILHSWLGYQPRCRRLDLTDISLSAHSLYILAGFSHLETLFLDGCLLDHSSNEVDSYDSNLCTLLRQCQNITELNLRGVVGSLECLGELSPRIQILNIGACRAPGLSSFDLGSLLATKPLPKLSQLLMAKAGVYKASLSVSFLPAIAPKLTVLDLTDCNRMTDVGSLAELPALRDLFLNGIFNNVPAPEVLDALKMLTGFDSQCRPSLVKLHLNDNRALEEDALRLVGRFPRMRELSLENVDAVNSETLRDICVSCVELEALTVRGCRNFDDQCLSVLGEACKSLSYLDLGRKGAGVSAEGIQTLLATLMTAAERQPDTPLSIYASDLHLASFAIEDLDLGDWPVSLTSDDMNRPPRRYPDASDELSDESDLDDDDWEMDHSEYLHSDSDDYYRALYPRAGRGPSMSDFDGLSDDDDDGQRSPPRPGTSPSPAPPPADT